MSAHSRLRDLWRWASLVPALGSMGSAVYLWDRRRRREALAIAVATLVEVALFVAGGADVHDHPGRSAGAAPAGIGVLLYVGLIVAIWMRPGTEAASPAPGTYAVRKLAPWPAVTARAQELTVRYGLLAYVAAFGGVVVLSLVLKALGAHLGVGAGVLVVDAILLGSLAPLVLSGRIGRRDLGLRGTRIGASAGLAVLALIAYVGLAAIWALIFIHAPTGRVSASRQFGISHYPGALTVSVDCFAIAISAPVCEEIFFRGLLYRCLRNRMSLWPAAIIAGCLFGLVHITSYPLDTIPIKMLFGVLMCLLYERTGSLLVTIAVHAFVDGTAADVIFAHNAVIALLATAAALLLVLARMAWNSFHGETELLVVEPPPDSDPGPDAPVAGPGSRTNVPW